MEDTLIISGIFKVIKKYFWVLLLSIIIGGIVGRVVTPAGPAPEYRTAALVLLEREVQPGVVLNSPEEIARFMNTAQTLVKIPAILDKVQKELRISEDTKALAEKLEVQNENSSMIIRIGAVDTDSKKVTKIVNKTAEVFSEEVGNYLDVKSAVVVQKAVEGQEAQFLHSRTNANTVMGIIIGLVIGTLIVFVLSLLNKRKIA